MEEEYKKWLTQLRKGYVELCILLILEKNEKLHGIAILKLFKDRELKINEGTLYPLLNRMEQNEWLSSQWNMPSKGGHPKREYSISKKGKEFLPLLLEAYQSHDTVLQNLIGEKV
jgi:PadR family transcriptional regulator PadR